MVSWPRPDPSGRLHPVRRRRWLAGLLGCLLVLILGGPLGLPLGRAAGLSLDSHVPAAGTAPGQAPLSANGKVPGVSPGQTLENFLTITGQADRRIRQAVKRGMNEPGLWFPPTVHQQVDQATRDLQRATEALDLSQIPIALRPMTGVGSMLMLRSLLLYDLSQNPGLQVPAGSDVRSEQLQSWTIPGTSITLRALTSADLRPGDPRPPCQQCTVGDFVFSADSLEQVPADFETVFGDHPELRRRFSADLYMFWALMPGGAIPPKPFLMLPPPLRRLLLNVVAGQSLLQWLILIPVTLGLVLLLAWWLLSLRAWHAVHGTGDGPLIHGLAVLALLPPLLVVWFWQWFAINWVNLTGPREEAVLIGSSALNGLLWAVLLYLLAEFSGQLLVWKRSRGGGDRLSWVRRRGSGQIMTMARVAGVAAVVVVVVRTGQDLGLTSLTLLALSSVPALAISLGTQQLIRDVADGFSLLLDGQLKPGDRCTIGTPKSGELKGRIASMGMRSMRLHQEDGAILSIPNSQVAASVVANHSLRTVSPFSLSLPVADAAALDLPRYLQAVRELLAAWPDLEDAAVTLDAANPGWTLRLRGRWRSTLAADEIQACREALILRLMRLPEPDPPAAAPPGGAAV